MSNEVWKDIKGYEGLYQVSSLGRVKSVERVVVQSNGYTKTVKESIRKPKKDQNGYLQVGLSKNGVVKRYTVHKLVATAFIQKDDLFADTVNHKNEIKTDNRAENLEWMNNGDNSRYSHRDGGTAYNRGSKHPRARRVRCIETGEVFGSQIEASKWLGFSRGAVNNAIYQGSRCGGYHWEYV